MSLKQGKKILAITGGVGGAKLALGLSQILSEDELVFAVNTGDDFCHMGLSISPDIDTLVYALSGLSDYQRGWGVVDETWSFMAMLEKLQGPKWFQLGDKDLAMHLRRTELLSAGEDLTQVTNQLASSLGIKHRLLPMSNDCVATQLNIDDSWVDFQDYFVAQQCKPVVKAIRYQGADSAQANPEILQLLQSEQLQAVIICPSNPFLSIAPMLALSEIRDALLQTNVPVVVVSPIVGGLAIKGPTAKLMAELAIEQSAKSIADWYGELLDVFVLDQVDEHLRDQFNGTPLLFAQTVMKTLDDKKQLAQMIVQHINTVFVDSAAGVTC